MYYAWNCGIIHAAHLQQVRVLIFEILTLKTFVISPTHRHRTHVAIVITGTIYEPKKLVYGTL